MMAMAIIRRLLAILTFIQVWLFVRFVIKIIN